MNITEDMKKFRKILAESASSKLSTSNKFILNADKFLTTKGFKFSKQDQHDGNIKFTWMSAARDVKVFFSEPDEDGWVNWGCMRRDGLYSESGNDPKSEAVSAVKRQLKQR